MNTLNKANEPLNIIENKFAKAFLQNSVPMAITAIKDGRYIDVSDAFLDLMGLLRDEVIGNTSIGIGFITAEQRSIVLNELEKKGRVENLELQVRTKGSELRYGLFNSTKISIAGEEHLLTVVTDITERNQAQEALKASEAKYRRLHDTMRDAFVSVDMCGKIIEFNEAYRKMLGYEPHELLKLTYKDLTPEKWHAVEDAIVEKQILHLGYSDLYEKEYLKKDGTVFPVELRTILIRDDAGEPTGMWAIVHDITEHKRVGEALRQANEYNRSLIDASLDPLVTFGPDGRITDVNTATEQATGCSRNELIGTDFSDYFTEPDKARNGYQKVFREGFVRDYELELRHRDGQITSVLYNASVYRDSSGQVAGVIAAARDISERKKTGEALGESEARHRFLTEKINDVVWVTDMEFNLTYMSPSVEKIMGYTPQERQGNKASSTMTPESAAKSFEMFVAEIQRVQETGSRITKPILMELEYIHKNGSTVWMEVNASLMLDAAGKILGAHGVSRDITKRKCAEVALRESEAKYRFLTEKMYDIIWTADLDFRLTYDSPSVERVLGYTLQERMEQKTSEMLTPESYAHALEVMSAELMCDQDEGVDPDRTIKLELEYYHKNGSTVWMECIVSAIRDHTGKISGIHGVSRDITKRKQAETILGQFKFMVEETGEEIYLVNPDGSIEYVNKAAAQSLGYTVDEMIKMGVSGFDPIYGANYFDVFQEIKAKKDPLYETVHRTKDGRLVQKEIKCAYLQMGNREYVCGSGRDVTDRKSAEMELKKHRDQLEELINERTVELTKAYEFLKQENEARKASESALRSREIELEKGRRELEEMNAALKVLLKQREEDKVNMEMNIISNIKTSVLPYLEKLELSGLAEGQMRVSSLIKSLLGEITSPFIKKVSSEFLGFTPNEIQVASLVKEGKSSKEIADILNISLNTVHTYRYKIRIKTGLKNNKVNLRSYLQTLG
jgi:PAS domain S-box-containing protein